MIKSRIKIGDGDIYDFERLFGFVQVASDTRFAAPTKAYEQSSYPEQAGVNILPITVDDTFEYKATFFINARGGLNNANWKIEDFNKAICPEDKGVKKINQITFYNDYKKIKIVGYPMPIAEATEFWRDASGKQHDVVCVELVIKVTDPSLCNFNLDSEDYEVFIVEKDVFYVKK